MMRETASDEPLNDPIVRVFDETSGLGWDAAEPRHDPEVDSGLGQTGQVGGAGAGDETAGCARVRIDTERWAGLAAAVLRAEGVVDGELGLRFVDLDVMAELNLAHMGASGPTDVLAFPIDGGNGRDRASDPAVLLGDVVVCPAYAARAAGAGGLADELALLVVHGVLHVLGYDHAHDEEAAAMQARERRLLAAHHRQP